MGTPGVQPTALGTPPPQPWYKQANDQDQLNAGDLQQPTPIATAVAQ
jgi:hypothetical protein